MKVMIDEKKIEEAAEEYSWFHSENEEEQLEVKGAFKAGINWFLENLLHDFEEVPTEKNKNVLRYFESYSVDERELDYDEYYELCNTGKDGFDKNTWKIFCDIGGWCSSWLYIEDLMKGGSRYGKNESLQGYNASKRLRNLH